MPLFSVMSSCSNCMTHFWTHCISKKSSYSYFIAKKRNILMKKEWNLMKFNEIFQSKKSWHNFVFLHKNMTFFKKFKCLWTNCELIFLMNVLYIVFVREMCMSSWHCQRKEGEVYSQVSVHCVNDHIVHTHIQIWEHKIFIYHVGGEVFSNIKIIHTYTSSFFMWVMKETKQISRA